MDLIIGGAFQGKLDYAKEHFSITDDDICTCSADADVDTTKRCIYHYEQAVLRNIRTGCGLPELREDAVVIIDDIFCGVVPIDKEIRAWREESGRAMSACAQKSDTVTRIFCGLPLKLK